MTIHGSPEHAPLLPTQTDISPGLDTKKRKADVLQPSEEKAPEIKKPSNEIPKGILKKERRDVKADLKKDPNMLKALGKATKNIKEEELIPTNPLARAKVEGGKTKEKLKMEKIDIDSGKEKRLNPEFKTAMNNLSKSVNDNIKSSKHAEAELINQNDAKAYIVTKETINNKTVYLISFAYKENNEVKAATREIKINPDGTFDALTKTDKKGEIPARYGFNNCKHLTDLSKKLRNSETSKPNIVVDEKEKKFNKEKQSAEEQFPGFEYFDNKENIE